MTRTDQELELSRTFSAIETWEQFLYRWHAIDTVQQAVGLLYAGAEIPFPREMTQEVEAILERCRFYLRWSRHSERSIATIAQQLIVKKWLRRASLYDWKVELVPLQGELFLFLSERRDPLTRPPYPRFIAEFLLPALERWQITPDPHERRHEAAVHQALQAYGEPLVHALCVWGLANVLARGHGDFPFKIRLLEQYLQSVDFDPERVLMKIGDHGQPLENISFLVAQEETTHRAALALLKLRHWHAWQQTHQTEVNQRRAARGQEPMKI